MKSKEEVIAELTEQGARIVFAQHILSGNRDERVRDYFSEERYRNMKLNLEATNLELVNTNKELSNKISMLEMCIAIQDKRVKGLDKEIKLYKEKYEIALKAIEELEKIIDKGHYIKKCCKK
jgi:hypothetical protein